jgi:hypothetical protein
LWIFHTTIATRIISRHTLDNGLIGRTHLHHVGICFVKKKRDFLTGRYPTRTSLTVRNAIDSITNSNQSDLKELQPESRHDGPRRSFCSHFFF